MRLKSRLLATAFIFVLSTGAGVAQDSVDDTIQFTDDMWAEPFVKMLAHDPVYLDKNFVFSITAPAANSSEETRQEIATLLEYQNSLRTPETIAKAEVEQYNFSEALVFGAGEPVSRDVQKRVNRAFGRGHADMSYFLFREKMRYKRARPTQLSSELTAALDIPGHAAYPSGHGMQARYMARVYGYVDPTHAELYIKAADELAQRREIMGLHYPSDTRAGQIMADEFFDTLVMVESYRSELDEVKRLYAQEKI
jgi:acid phosphatase (class A)